MKRILFFFAALAAFWAGSVAYAIIVIRGPVPVAAGGPTEIFSDNFDAYADTAALHSQTGWAQVASDVFNISKPASLSRAYANTGASRQLIRATATLNDDQYAEVTLYCDTTGGGTNAGAGPAVRVSNSAQSGYFVFLYNGGLYLEKFNAGSNAALSGSPYAGTYPTGTIVRLEVTGSGSATRLTLKADTGGGWTTVASSIDPGGTYLSTGYAGLGGYGSADANGSAESFRAGNL